MLTRLVEIILLTLLLYPLGKSLLQAGGNNISISFLESILAGFFIASTWVYLLAFAFPVSPLMLLPLIILSAFLLIYRVRKHKISRQALTNYWPAFLLSAAIASLPIMLPDYGIYYYQTVLALNEYGWLKGIANLEPRFALGSSIHVFAAATKSTYGPPLSINGMLFCAFITQAIRSYLHRDFQIGAYWTLVLILSFPFIFLMLSSQSPDVLGLVIFAALIDNEFLKKHPNRFLTGILISMAVLLKPNVAYSALVFGLVSLLSKPPQKKEYLPVTALFTVAAAAYISKNIVTSGFPLFPISFARLGLPWSVPKEALSEALQTLREGQVYAVESPLEETGYLRYILFDAGLKSVLNWFTFIGFLGLLVLAWFNRKSRIIAGMAISALLIIPVWMTMNTTPNFRLGMHFLIPMLAIIVLFLADKQIRKVRTDRAVQALKYGSILISLGLFVMPDIDLSRVVQNQYYSKLHFLQIENLLQPLQLKRTVRERSQGFPRVYYDLYPDHKAVYVEEQNMYVLLPEETPAKAD